MRPGTLLGAWLFVAMAGAFAAPFAYLPNDAHQLQQIDLATGAIGPRIQLVGSQPVGIAINASGDRAYVTDVVANLVNVVNLTNSSIAATVGGVCTPPLGPGIPALNPSATELVVPCSGTTSNPGTEVVVVNTASNSVSARLIAGSGPIIAAWNPAGTRFYVANAIGGTISVFNATNNSLVQTIDLPGVFAIAFNPAGTRLYASRDMLTGNANTTRAIAVIDPSTGSTLTTISVADDIIWLSTNPSGTRLYAAFPNADTIGIIDTGTNTALTPISTGAGSQPVTVNTNSDGTRLYVLLGTSNVAIYDAASLARLNTINYATNAGVLGNFVSAGPASTGANTPGPLSGLWWNHNESGWGVDFTQRGNTIFAAWYTYDSIGNPKWYVTTCTNIASSCSGQVLQVIASHGFFVQSIPLAITSVNVGTVTFAFNGNDAGTMTYSVGGVSRSTAIERQPLQASGTAPPVNYTDLWWGGQIESGWGLAITHQFSTMFLAWYVYNDSGQPMWYVATITNATSSGGTGQLYRTTGPAFSTSFNPNAVVAIPAGTITVNFTDANNGTINYTVTGEGSGSKTITRQIF
jgi:YVTN family beta-propeller protein